MLHLRLTQPTPLVLVVVVGSNCSPTSTLHGARVAHVVAVFVRERGTGENSTLEIRRTYVARNAAGKLHRDAPSLIPLRPFSALSTPVHPAVRNCQEVRGSLDAPKCHDCKAKIKKGGRKERKKRPGRFEENGRYVVICCPEDPGVRETGG